MITEFAAAPYRYQCLANGFLKGKVMIDENLSGSILLEDGIVIPTFVKPQQWSKIKMRGIDLAHNCILGVYPKVQAGQLTVEINKIFNSHEVNPELTDKFRVRGRVMSFDGYSAKIKVTTRKNVRETLELFTDGEYYELDPGEFWEINCNRVGNKLVINRPLLNII